MLLSERCRNEMTVGCSGWFGQRFLFSAEADVAFFCGSRAQRRVPL